MSTRRTTRTQPEPEQPKTRKICIVGFTRTRSEAPWDDPTWEVWGINNLHKYEPNHTKARLWFDLHDFTTIAQDAVHEAWLRTAPMPVVVWQPRPEWPSSVAFPKDAVLERFKRRYFTNSITWMVALAIMEGATHISIVGVDMAQSTEYSAQRPSCEWIIGVAEGLGIEVYIPPASDLLKTAALYGVDDDSALRTKLLDRKAELEGRLREAEQQHHAAGAAMLQLRGALEDVNYWLHVWMMPEVKRPDVDPALQ